jgi:hypothetical protein
MEKPTRGELFLGGALASTDRALPLLADEDASAAERFAEGDPSWRTC